jgi:hypothetical protein
MVIHERRGVLPMKSSNISMQVRRASIFATLLGLLGCAAADPAAELAKIATKTSTPPLVQRQSIEASIAMFASGCFNAGQPVWFIVKPDIPPVALFKAIDSAFGNKAKRVVETGPDQAEAQMRVWTVDRNDTAVVLAVLIDPASKSPGLAAYYAATLDPRWQPDVGAAGAE